MKMNSTATASIGLVIGGALWGLIWIPLRALGDYGLVGAWPGMFLYVGAALVLAPYALVRIKTLTRRALPLILIGLLTGAAFSLYSTAVLLTDVVRALLLFYLTPVWGTLIGRVFLGEKITPNRLLALTMALFGLVIILGLGQQFPWPRNLGDWLALSSGLCWALGSAAVYKLDDIPTGDKMFAFVIGSSAVTAICLLTLGEAVGANSGGPGLFDAPLILILAGLYVLPMIVLTIWPATILTPGRVGLLLMSDAIVGVISAALFAGEQFAWREFIGTLLIVSAAVVEVAGNSRSSEKVEPDTA